MHVRHLKGRAVLSRSQEVQAKPVDAPVTRWGLDGVVRDAAGRNGVEPAGAMAAWEPARPSSSQERVCAGEARALMKRASRAALRGRPRPHGPSSLLRRTHGPHTPVGVCCWSVRWPA